MKKTKLLNIVLATATACVLAVGCAVEASGPGGEVVVDSEPPPLQVDVETPAPGPDFVWVGGEWAWEGGRWNWHHGYWGHPPHAGAHWMAGRYEMRGGRRVYHRGGWH